MGTEKTGGKEAEVLKQISDKIKIERFSFKYQDYAFLASPESPQNQGQSNAITYEHQIPRNKWTITGDKARGWVLSSIHLKAIRYPDKPDSDNTHVKFDLKKTRGQETPASEQARKEAQQARERARQREQHASEPSSRAGPHKGPLSFDISEDDDPDAKAAPEAPQAAPEAPQREETPLPPTPDAVYERVAVGGVISASFYFRTDKGIGSLARETIIEPKDNELFTGEMENEFKKLSRDINDAFYTQATRAVS